MVQISILGCGWLGLALAKSLIHKGFSINGSTTSKIKIKQLKSASVTPFLITVHPDTIQGEIAEFLAQSEILIIDIPPKLRRTNAEDFTAKIEKLIPFIEQSSIKKVLFISSTSVYADNNNLVITEQTIPQPEKNSGKQLLMAEQLLQNNSYFRTTIIRFSGLIGEDRNPIHYLTGRENIEDPDGAINLIHQKDCIGIILRIIEKNIWNETFNGSAPVHPTREKYYTQKASDLGLPLPVFNHQKPSSGKIISNEKIKKILGYKFEILDL